MQSSTPTFTPAHASSSPDEREGRGAALLEALQGLLAAHERLLDFAGQRERALRAGDMERLAGVIERENAVVAEVARLDRQRGQAVEGILSRRAGEAPAPAGSERRAGEALTIHEVAPALPQPMRERVLSVAATLRQRIETLHEKNAALQAAAAALARHAQGLLRETESRLNHSGAYSDRGVVGAGPAVLSAVDITT